MSLREQLPFQMLPVAVAERKIILESLALTDKYSRLEVVALTLCLLTQWPQLVTLPPLTTWSPGSAILPFDRKAEGKHFWQTALMAFTVSVVIMLLH